MSKTIRIEESLYDLVRTYVKEHNEIFDIELNERQVIESCIKRAMVEKIETLANIRLQRILEEMDN